MRVLIMLARLCQIHHAPPGAGGRLHVQQQDEGAGADFAVEGAGFGQGGRDKREEDEGDGRLRMWYEWQVRREIGVRLQRDDDEEEKREEEEEQQQQQQERVGCEEDVRRGCGSAVSEGRCKSERGELQAAQRSYDHCNNQYQNEGGMSHSIFLP